MVARVEGGELVVEATITNDRTGHHVPTGVTVRNMILRVEARDADGGMVGCGQGRFQAFSTEPRS